MIALPPAALPAGEALVTATGAPPLAVYRRVVALALPAHGADGLRFDAALTQLAGSFTLHDFAAPAAAIAGPSSGVFTVTLDAPRQVHRVTLNSRPSHKVSLLRLDGNRQAPPTVTQTGGTAFPGPPADFTDRRFAVRIDDPGGEPEKTAPASALNQILLRSRPARPRLALAAPGQEASATVFWTAPVVAAPPDEVAITAAGPALAAALQAYVDALEGPLGASVALSLVAESDAPCRLTLTAVAAGYRLVRATFAGEHAGRPKAVLAFPAGAVEPAGVELALPAAATVASAAVATSETLPAARAPSGDWTERAGSLAGVTSGVHVTPGHGAAARLAAGAGARVARVALGVLALEAPAELQVQLIADRDGAPAGPPLAEGSVMIASATAGAATGAGSAGRREWVSVGVGDVPLAPGAGVWVAVSAARGSLVWLAPPAADGEQAPPLRGRDGAAIDGLAVLAELLGAPPAAQAEASAEPLALAVGDVAVPAPSADGDARSFDIAAALQEQLASGDGTVTVPLTFRALGPGTVTVYPPVVEYDL